MFWDDLEGWGGVGGRFKRDVTYVYLFMLLYGRSQHNIVKQLFSSEK